MNGSGRVLGIRQTSFKGRDGKTEINMLYFDVYDPTCKMVPCELVQDVEHPLTLAEDMKVTFVVTRFKEANFGGGIVAVVKDVLVTERPVPRPIGESAAMPPPPGAPLPGAGVPQPAGARTR